MLFNSETETFKEKVKKSMPTKEEKNNFSIQIESIVVKHKSSYIEAITIYCEQINLEVEVAASLLNDAIKSKIELEAQQLRYLPRSSRLPI